MSSPLSGLRDCGTRACPKNTLQDYSWQLCNHLLPFFADHRLSKITIAEVDRYRPAKVREGALSATSINKTITRLAQILEVAVEYELIDRNPARGEAATSEGVEARAGMARPGGADRTLLDAGGELRPRGAGGSQATSRRAILATLTLAGLRIGECSICGGATSTYRRSDHGAGAKTDAGVRQVDMLPALRDELSTTRRRGADGSPTISCSTEQGARQHATTPRRGCFRVGGANEHLTAR